MRRTLVLVMAAALLASAGLADAQEEEPPAGSEGAPEGAMLIILDASGSMSTLDEDGVSFIDKAKDAVLQLIDALPDGMQVGLRVYGHREPNTDAVTGCRDTELVAPVAPLDRDAIRSAVEGLEASGFTPIGLSLQEAAGDFPESGPRSIVLISDGEDTCAPPDPCQIAEDLYGELFDVRIESVGFLIDTGSAAEQQLRCIAETTGGGYTTVGRADALVAHLAEVADELIGWASMTLNGALDPAEAPVLPLVPKADWLTDEPGKIAVSSYEGLLMPGETRWYSIDLWVGEWLWIWADVGWPPGLDAGGTFEIIILDSAGNRVETPVGHGGYPLQTELPGSGSPMAGAALTEYEGVRPADTYLVGLHWDAPPEVFLATLYLGAEVLGGDTLAYEARTEVEGSADPSLAPVLDLAAIGPEWRGGEFRAPLAAGETRWYRMDLERGEAMNVFALFPGDRVVGEGTEGEFTIVLTDGDGNPVGSAFEEWPQMSQAFGGDRHQATVSGTTSFDPDPLPETVLIGFTWDGTEGQTSEIRFEAEALLDEQRKEAADAIEAAQGQGGESGGEADPASTTIAPPLTTIAADPPTTAAAATTTATPATAAEDPDGDGGSPLVAILIVVGLAAVGAAGAGLLMRRLRDG